jgi:hypothetical protein
LQEEIGWRGDLERQMKRRHLHNLQAFQAQSICHSVYKAQA